MRGCRSLSAVRWGANTCINTLFTLCQQNIAYAFLTALDTTLLSCWCRLSLVLRPCFHCFKSVPVLFLCMFRDCFSADLMQFSHCFSYWFGTKLMMFESYNAASSHTFRYNAAFSRTFRYNAASRKIDIRLHSYTQYWMCFAKKCGVMLNIIHKLK